MAHDEDTCPCCQEWIALDHLKLEHVVRGPVWLTQSEVKETPVASIVAQVPFHVSIGCGCFTIRMHKPVDMAALRKALGSDWIVRQTRSVLVDHVYNYHTKQYSTRVQPKPDRIVYDVLVCKREPLTERDKELAMKEYEKSL
jgi:hypothetical protein